MDPYPASYQELQDELSYYAVHLIKFPSATLFKAQEFEITLKDPCSYGFTIVNELKRVNTAIYHESEFLAGAVVIEPWIGDLFQYQLSDDIFAQTAYNIFGENAGEGPCGPLISF